MAWGDGSIVRLRLCWKTLCLLTVFLVGEGRAVTVKKIVGVPSAELSFRHESVSFGDAIYFSAAGKDPDTGLDVGIELWKFDGVEITLAANIKPNHGSSVPRGMTEYNGALYFQADDGVHSIELWKHDGTQAEFVREFGNSTTPGDPAGFAVWQDTLYFTASPLGGGGADRELWKYDGTTFTKIVTPTSSNRPSEVTAHDDGLYFTTYEPATGNELYKYDGANWQIIETVPGPESAITERLYSFGGELYFVSRNFSENRDEIWRLGADGFDTIAGDLVPFSPLAFGGFGGNLYFRAYSETDGADLWKFDGSAFSPVVDINSSGSPELGWHIVSNGALYFSADDGIHGSELWVHDGVNTYMVDDILPGPDGSFPQGFAELNGVTYFFAFTDSETQIWAIVPEPASCVLSLLALTCFACRRRYR